MMILKSNAGSKVGEKAEGTRFPVSRARGEKSMTEFSDSEGENMPEMSTKSMNTSFPLDSSYERSPKFNLPSYSSLKHSVGRGSSFGSGRLFESKEPSKSSRSNDISRVVFFGVGLFFVVVTLVYFYNAFVVTPPPTSYIGELV